ncbi:SDR family NAD(P)-dependent oxidoreductase [Salinisphaera sp.]|uniref:SDR family NAD(P)-dependent oxidoreductase n=1 Tax=Salinisphaera sp. TaxID=1914330 RepID=UPI000C526F7D|nr:SDR family NAD(P)-dependent oxidoreductase [Salinisphaera sp.]MBS64027.1 acetoin dehydrogenase [Salinisphaera sp.]
MKDLNNKVVVITGAGSGIGRSLATACAQRGARLALCDVNTTGLEETRRECGDAAVLTASVDVSDRAAVEAFRDEVIAEYQQVDLVVNNAGVAHSQTIEDATYEDFEWIMGINFWGVVHGTKAFLPALKKNSGSALVNVSSVFGLISLPTQGTYNATKFAVRGFTEALRHETADSGLHVMCVHPGGIKTGIAHSARFYVGPDGSDDQEKAAGDFVNKLARTTPDQAARKILDDLAKRKGRCLIGIDAQIISAISRLMPVNYWRVMNRMMPG